MLIFRLQRKVLREKLLKQQCKHMLLRRQHKIKSELCSNEGRLSTRSFWKACRRAAGTSMRKTKQWKVLCKGHVIICEASLDPWHTRKQGDTFKCSACLCWAMIDWSSVIQYPKSTSEQLVPFCKDTTLYAMHDMTYWPGCTDINCIFWMQIQIGPSDLDNASSIICVSSSARMTYSVKEDNTFFLCRSRRGKIARGRGIAIAAGGPLNLANAYVTLHVLQEVHKSSLPIEVFFNGEAEFDNKTQQFFKVLFHISLRSKIIWSFTCLSVISHVYSATWQEPSFCCCNWSCCYQDDTKWYWTVENESVYQ